MDGVFDSWIGKGFTYGLIVSVISGLMIVISYKFNDIRKVFLQIVGFPALAVGGCMFIVCGGILLYTGVFLAYILYVFSQ
jgi:hypothetical protein